MPGRRENAPAPTEVRQVIESERSRWGEVYSGEEYYYGQDPGPVARRAVRYHRSYMPAGGTALDAGCGEGQDLAFLAEQGYEATGMEFVPDAVEKARRLLAGRGLTARVLEGDLRDLQPDPPYDLVLAVNSAQFMGADAEGCLDRLQAAVAPGGVIGLSLFGREGSGPRIAGTIYFLTLEELLGRFRGWQPLEAAKLWQWNPRTNRPQAFVTLVALNRPPGGRPIPLG